MLPLRDFKSISEWTNFGTARVKVGDIDFARARLPDTSVLLQMRQERTIPGSRFVLQLQFAMP